MTGPSHPGIGAIPPQIVRIALRATGWLRHALRHANDRPRRLLRRIPRPRPPPAGAHAEIEPRRHHLRRGAFRGRSARRPPRPVARRGRGQRRVDRHRNGVQGRTDGCHRRRRLHRLPPDGCRRSPASPAGRRPAVARPHLRSPRDAGAGGRRGRVGQLPGAVPDRTAPAVEHHDAVDAPLDARHRRRSVGRGLAAHDGAGRQQGGGATVGGYGVPALPIPRRTTTAGSPANARDGAHRRPERSPDGVRSRRRVRVTARNRPPRRSGLLPAETRASGRRADAVGRRPHGR